MQLANLLPSYATSQSQPAPRCLQVIVDMEKDVLTVVDTGKTYPLKPLGDAGPVIDAGGIFDYARSQGMIKTA